MSYYEEHKSVLSEFSSGKITISQMSESQQIMCSLALEKPELMPEKWKNKSSELIQRRIDSIQRKVIEEFKNS